jgi:hypothetical protein
MFSALAPDGSPVDGFAFEGNAVSWTGDEPVEAGIRYKLGLPSGEPDWLVPGVFYGENRVESCTRPRFTLDRVDVARMGSNAWSFRADRCSTPAVFCGDRGLITQETSPLGQSGVGFVWRGGRPVVWVDWRIARNRCATTAGISWIPALVEAGELDAARRAGAYYRTFDTFYGAPEDIDLAPTSEDGYAALMAFVALEDWEAARRAADWMLSFRYTYDVVFPETTLLGRYARYRQSARENLACFRQFIARADGDFDAYRGMASERYYQTDCFQAKGMLLTLSHAWSVGVLLLGCEDALELGIGNGGDT